jgi:hypothetical protein
LFLLSLLFFGQCLDYNMTFWQPPHDSSCSDTDPCGKFIS